MNDSKPVDKKHYNMPDGNSFALARYKRPNRIVISFSPGFLVQDAANIHATDWVSGHPENQLKEWVQDKYLWKVGGDINAVVRHAKPGALDAAAEKEAFHPRCAYKIDAEGLHFRAPLPRGQGILKYASRVFLVKPDVLNELDMHLFGLKSSAHGSAYSEMYMHRLQTDEAFYKRKLADRGEAVSFNAADFDVILQEVGMNLSGIFDSGKIAESRPVLGSLLGLFKAHKNDLDTLQTGISSLLEKPINGRQIEAALDEYGKYENLLKYYKPDPPKRAL